MCYHAIGMVETSQGAQLIIRLSRRLHQRFKVVCADGGKSMTGVVVNLIQVQVNEYEASRRRDGAERDGD